MNLYEVWIEGYSITGDSGTARRLGFASGTSFPEVCKKMITDLGWDLQYYDEEKNTFWGSRFFDNEKQARQVFG